MKERTIAALKALRHPKASIQQAAKLGTSLLTLLVRPQGPPFEFSC